MKRLLIFFYNKLTNKKYHYSFLWVLLAKIQNINIPDDASTLFKFSYSVLLLSLVAFVSFINLMNTILILQFKDKLDLEVRFKNYPIILKIIKYYESVSFINILIETIFVILAILSLLFISFFAVYKIIKW